MDDELKTIWKEEAPGLNRVTIVLLPFMDWGRQLETWISIASVSADIRTEHFPNESRALPLDQLARLLLVNMSVCYWQMPPETKIFCLQSGSYSVLISLVNKRVYEISKLDAGVKDAEEWLTIHIHRKLRLQIRGPSHPLPH
jgi:hypothetical protein